jgi:hypothetical protein
MYARAVAEVASDLEQKRNDIGVGDVDVENTSHVRAEPLLVFSPPLGVDKGPKPQREKEEREKRAARRQVLAATNKTQARQPWQGGEVGWFLCSVFMQKINCSLQWS